MSTPFYDLASLVLVPSGYKAQKVYAQKPLTTDGQLSFSRASTATRVNSAGLIETVSSNVPRLDYLGSSCPKLQLEPSRTNAITWSENVASCLTSQVGTTVAADATTSPDGTANADKITFGSGNAYRLRGETVAASTTYTFSVFIKNDTFSGSEQVFINLSDGVVGGLTATYVPAQATITVVGSAGAWTGVSGKVENYGNGWYRVIATGTSVGGGSGWFEIATVNTPKAAFFWGFSLEIGAYATSYIRTTTATVTRLADVCLSATASSLFNSPSGVFYWEGNFDSNSTPPGGICVSGSFGNRVQMYNSGADVYAIVDVASNNVFSANTTGVNITQNHKYAVSWSLNDFTFYVDGVQVASDTSGATFSSSTLNQFRFSDQSTNYFYANVKKVIVFPTRLTNAQLAELTAL